MKKNILFILALICISINAYSAERPWIIVTAPAGVEILITLEDQQKMAYSHEFVVRGGSADWVGFEEELFQITFKNEPVEIYGDFPLFSNKNSFKGCHTIDFTNAPTIKSVELINDDVLNKVVLHKDKILSEVKISNLTKLTEIDLSECEGIENLIANKLPISKLNIAKSTLLKTLDCSDCELETLTLPANSAVNKINCSGNKLTEEAVGELIAALPTTGGELCIYNEAAENNNECTAKQVEEAKAKNWKVVDAAGNEYKGSGAIVSNLKVINVTADNAPYYDLQGRRIAKPTRSGLYIHNGKKIFIK